MIISEQPAIQKQTSLDPRIKRTRKLIYEAFGALLAEKDFQSITVQDIAERAEVNRATFYAHFEDKYALLAYSVRDHLQDLLARRTADDQTLTLANLKLLAATVCDFMGQFNGGCHRGLQNNDQMFIADQVQQSVYETLLNWFLRTENGHNRPLIASEQAATTVSWVILGASIQSIRKSTATGQSPEVVADQMLSLLVMGLDAYLNQ